MQARGRPRRIDDEMLIAAYQRVSLHMGPTWTLADVASEAGVVAGTLAQRFGSKRGLMVAALRHEIEELSARVAVVREYQTSSIDGLRRLVQDLVAGIETPGMMANSIALLHVELSDPELRPVVQEYVRAIEQGMAAFVISSEAAGELRIKDAQSVAKSVYTAYSGTLVTYAIHGEGQIGAWVWAAIDSVLTPYRGSYPSTSSG